MKRFLYLCSILVSAEAYSCDLHTQVTGNKGLQVIQSGDEIKVAKIEKGSTAADEGHIAVGDKVLAVKQNENDSWTNVSGKSSEDINKLINGSNKHVWLKLQNAKEYTVALKSQTAGE
jgi:C-terminal processing protease CtpA/Prc